MMICTKQIKPETRSWTDLSASNWSQSSSAWFPVDLLTKHHFELLLSFHTDHVQVQTFALFCLIRSKFTGRQHVVNQNQADQMETIELGHLQTVGSENHLSLHLLQCLLSLFLPPARPINFTHIKRFLSALGKVLHILNLKPLKVHKREKKKLSAVDLVCSRVRATELQLQFSRRPPGQRRKRRNVHQLICCRSHSSLWAASTNHPSLFCL